MHIFILIDALGWEYAEQTDFLRDLLTHRTPLRTVLGFSSGAIPTILTGMLPRQHGQWNLFYYDPVHSPFRWLRHFGFLPDRLMEHRVTRKLLKELGRRVLGMGRMFECTVSTKALPWFNWTEKANIYEPGGIPGAPSIFDQLTERGIPYRAYSYHTGTDAELLQRATRDAARGEAQLLFVYLSEMDAFLHNHCNDAPAIHERLDWYASEIRQLAAAARRVDPSARISLFSDHGMTPVRQHFDLAAIIDRLPYSSPKDYLACYDATMARFWTFSRPARDQIVEALGRTTCGHVLSGDELQALGIDFSDQRYGEIIYLMDPAWLISNSGFHKKGWLPKGMHGYHPDDHHSDGVFLSDSRPASTIAELTDIHGYMQAAVR